MNLQGSTQPLDKALQAYHAAWHELVMRHQLQTWAAATPPTTISWKVADKPTLFANIEQLVENTEQLHIATVDKRFIASIVLKIPYMGMRLVKILERRPQSPDQLGLDSIDYLVEDIEKTEQTLAGLADATVQPEHNDMHAWLSVRFGPDQRFEAKFSDHLVLKVAQAEMALSERDLLTSLDA